MMESVKVRQRIGQDGILHLDISVGLADRDVEVMVIYQAVQSEISTELSLEDLYGICADDLIRIDESGIGDALDEDLAGAFE
ncbi:hypothetical protein [Leptolyngbya sp. PCC 6406]|uniref:hypothetical protein n=1 Tax=Leptolyngbya sp. PCC 6406 TaxID=1173264 RepID=UPI0002ACD488|nr:hypothetical protein [Leptolyngbya sp. PCC 6406]